MSEEDRLKLENELLLTKSKAQMINLYLDLQQKVEQLEKENIKQKEIIENLTTMTVCGDKKQIKNTSQCKLEQLESIINEVKEECKSVIGNPEHTIVSKNELMKIMLSILNKGDNNVKDKR